MSEPPDNVPDMPRVHPGATLTPHFRDFLPPWVALQPWYVGSGVPSLRPVGYYRFEDPAGEVGVETHLLADGATLYQIPLTYRGAPREAGRLIATAEHSVLGRRWIYDAETDSVWTGQLLRIVLAGGAADPSGKRGVGPVQARGHRSGRDALPSGRLRIDLVHRPAAGARIDDPAVAGVLVGTWHPDGPDRATVTGCLALLRPVGQPERPSP
jgi:hypothetical protein